MGAVTVFLIPRNKIGLVFIPGNNALINFFVSQGKNKGAAFGFALVDIFMAGEVGFWLILRLITVNGRHPHIHHLFHYADNTQLFFMA